MAKYDITKASDEKLDILYYEISRSNVTKAFCVISVEEHSRRSVIDFYIETDSRNCEFPVTDIVHLIESSVIELNEWADRIRDPSSPFKTSTLAVAPDSLNFITKMSFEKAAGGQVIATNSENKLPVFELSNVEGILILRILPAMYRSTLSTSHFVEQLKQAVALASPT